MTTIFSLNLIEDPKNGQRYMRVIDAADILRGIAQHLEKLDICDGKDISDEIRLVARDLEDKVAAYRRANP